MTSYMMNQKVFIKTFYLPGGSCVAVERQYHERVVCIAALRNIYWIVKQCEERGSKCDEIYEGA
jgi:hypothetical protein